MNPNVDLYLKEGCGRCDLYQTPQCKVHTYPEVLRQLRMIVLGTELVEDFKWKQPCYTLNDSNVLLVTAFKDFACISFFKGSLMKDPDKMLSTPGQNSQAVRQLRYTTPEEVIEQEPQIKAFIQQAIELEQSGAKVDFKAKKQLDYPEELLQKFEALPQLQTAFEALTPGRQRGYLLHFTGAKQSETRSARIDKYTEKILSGKGFHDR